MTGRVLVTGASGFVGSALVGALVRNGAAVRACYRGLGSLPQASAVENVAVGDLGASTDWAPALKDVDAVVHLAGPAHARFSEALMHEQITRATLTLAVQAERAGVRRFVYVSSIKAVCERTSGVAISEDDEPAPEGVYGRAKLAAEKAIISLPSLAPVVLRPPLVIAPDAKANFARLMKLAAMGVPLPLGRIANRRSLLSRTSLVEAICSLVEMRDGPTGIFHLADRPALSTSSILEALSAGMGRHTPMFGGFEVFLPRQLTDSLEVNDARLRTSIGGSWSRDARSAVFDCGLNYRNALP